MLSYIGLCWVILGHIGPHWVPLGWVTLSYIGSLWVALGHVELHWVVLGHFGSFWVTLGHIGSLCVGSIVLTYIGSLWVTLGHIEFDWVVLGHVGSISVPLGHVELHWVTLGHFGSRWIPLGRIPVSIGNLPFLRSLCRDSTPGEALGQGLDTPGVTPVTPSPNSHHPVPFWSCRSEMPTLAPRGCRRLLPGGVGIIPGSPRGPRSLGSLNRDAEWGGGPRRGRG